MTRSERAPQRKKNRLVAVTLDENSIGRSNPDVVASIPSAGPALASASDKSEGKNEGKSGECVWRTPVRLAQVRATLSPEASKPHVDALLQLPYLLEETLKVAPEIEEIASRFQTRTDFLYLGRGINYPIALEGALKLKEISYIHAEGYPAGEMKHGPIALIDERMPVVALAPPGEVLEKMIGNMQ